MFFYRAAGHDTSVIWAKLLYFFPTVTPTAFLLFGLYFPNNTVSKKVVWVIILSTILMASLSLVDKAVIANVLVQPGHEKRILFGWAYYYLYIFYFPLFFLSSYYVLFRKYLKATAFVRMQILYILLGMTAASVPAMITNLNLPTFGYFELNWAGQLCTVFWISGVAYAIIKHRLLDIRLVVARTIAYSLLVLILGAAYAFGFIVVGDVLIGKITNQVELLTSSVLALLMALSFQPLRKILETATDKFFFKGYYDSQQLLQSLSSVMSSTIELENLMSTILDHVLTQIRISRGAFILLSKDASDGIAYVAAKGYDSYVPRFTKETILLFLRQKTILISDDLEEGTIKEAMRTLHISIVLPLVVHENNIGVVVFSDKASGDIYSPQDINVLGILAPELSVAIQNAKEYEEIKRFNITLREEIDKATKDLQNANERLKSLDKLKDEFVSLASHELRTPMTAIKSYSWMLREERQGQLNEKQKEYADRIYTSTERQIRLVNDMLDVSRIDAGRMTLNPKPIDLAQLAQSVFAEVLPSAQNQNIALVLQPPSSPLGTVLADEDKTKEVFINLIGNSLKFTPPGGKITIAFEQQGDMILTRVTDNGKGIKAEDMPKLFRKFGMIEGNYTRTSGQGTGLGLYISKSIIQLQGGTMSVFSEGENKGTTFTFTLKKAQNTATQQEQQIADPGAVANTLAPFPEHPQA